MAYNHTVLGQILKLVPRHEFEREAREHHEGRRLRKMTRWGQFVAMVLGQLAGGAVCATSWGIWTCKRTSSIILG